MQSVDDMKKYICQMVDKIFLDTDLIMNFLSENNIPCSNNNNGIFINISLLSDEVIGKFYNLIQEKVNDRLINDKYEEECEMYLSGLDKIKGENTETHLPANKEIDYEPLELSGLQARLLSFI